jgi:hypothetical protein
MADAQQSALKDCDGSGEVGGVGEVGEVCDGIVDSGWGLVG